jgi:hypothetical protein
VEEEEDEEEEKEPNASPNAAADAVLKRARANEVLGEGICPRSFFCDHLPVERSNM